jgi:hypothetical protein
MSATTRGGGGKDLVPLGKGLVGGDEDGLGVVAAGDELKEQVGVAVVIGEVADLIEGKQLKRGVTAEPALQGGGTVLCGEVVEELAGSDEASGGAPDDGLVDEILGDHRFADAIGPDQDDVGGGLDPVESEDRTRHPTVLALA